VELYVKVFNKNLNTIMYQLKIFTFLLVFFCGMGQINTLKATTYRLNENAFYLTWDDPNSWIPQGVPGATDSVIMDEFMTMQLNGDVEVGTLIIDNLSGLSSTTFPLFKVTVKQSMVCRFPTNFVVDVVIDNGATALFNGPNLSTAFGSIYFNGTLLVKGSFEADVFQMSATKFIVEGNFVNKKGTLSGEMEVKTGGTLTLNHPDNTSIAMSNMTNAGTVNWQSGNIRRYGPFTNSGVFNIAANNDTLIFDGFFLTEGMLINTGQINFNVAQRVTLNQAIDNQGAMTISGSPTIGLTGLVNKSTINGPTATLELSGNYFGTENYLKSGSTLNVSKLNGTVNTRIVIEAGANVANIATFDLKNGLYEANTPLPQGATYFMEGSLLLAQNQTFTGATTFNNLSISSTNATINFNAQNTSWRDVYFDCPLINVSSNTTVDMKGLINSRNLNNSGTINYSESIGWYHYEGDITNNGTINLNSSGTMLSVFSTNASGEYNFVNAGTINVNPVGTGMFSLANNFRNNSTVNVATGDTLTIGNMNTMQNGTLTGGANSVLALSFGDFVFESGATTSNFAKIESNYSNNIQIKNGTNLANIGTYSFINSEVETNAVLNPNANYRLEGSTLRITTLFEPTTKLVVLNSNIEGSGSLRIANELQWVGGTLDVPVRINSNAIADVRESEAQRPIISAPFTNLGVVSLSGGIIEINTSFFKNTGIWQVKSEEDVIMDGFTPFVNEGTFAICGNGPIQIVYNIPFINESTGTFKGEGVYIFNAGYTNNGVVAPGCSPGLLRIDDNFQTGAGMDAEIESEMSGMFDVLEVAGNLTLSGRLRVLVPTGAAPAGPITIIKADGNITGTFSQVELPAGYTLTYNAQTVVVNASGMVNTDNLAAVAHLKVSPSPAADQLRIEIGQSANIDLPVQVFDMQGRLLGAATLLKNESVLTLPVADLPAGLYTLNVGGKATRFVKE
jgi:Secretion system C-terminal sorting domain